jgi:hypothetical protein
MTEKSSMSVSSGSRYSSLPIYDAPDVAGEEHPTIAIRPAPPVTSGTYQRTVAALDTLESLSWACYNSSTSWWKIADANPPIFPLDWRPGDAVAIPFNPNSGLIQRTRRF